MEPNNTMYPTPSWWQEGPVILVLIAPFLALAIIWQSLPARVPMHFDVRGNVNQYGDRWQLLILPLVNIVVATLLYFIPRLDPKRASIAASTPAYRWVRFAIAAFLTYVFALMLGTSLNPKLDVTPLIAVGLLAMFFGIGFAMPKFKQNYMIGIRLPWTLESEDNWNRTHAFAGKLWPWGSVVGIALVLAFPDAGIFIALGVLIVMMVWTGIYSYRIFREAKKLN